MISINDKTIAGSFSFSKMSEKKRREKSLYFLTHLSYAMERTWCAGGVECSSNAKVDSKNLKCTMYDTVADWYIWLHIVSRVDVSTLVNDVCRWYSTAQNQTIISAHCQRMCGIEISNEILFACERTRNHIFTWEWLISGIDMMNWYAIAYSEWFI